MPSFSERRQSRDNPEEKKKPLKGKKPVDEKWHVSHESLADPNHVPWKGWFVAVFADHFGRFQSCQPWKK